MLILKNISLDLGGFPILDKINLDICEGDFKCITGINGSGKTSLLMLIKGLYVSSSGIIDFAKNISYSSISYVSKRPNSFFMRLTVMENIEFFYNLMINRDKMPMNAIFDLINVLGLRDKINTECMSLSSGELQKLSIIRGLIRNPSIILFDESLSSMDSKSRSNFLHYYQDLISKNPHKATIWVTHNLNEIHEFNYDHFVLEGKKLKSIQKK